MKTVEVVVIENLRVKDVAKMLNVSVSTVWQYVKQGRFNYTKLSPKVTIFKKSDIENFLNSCQVLRK